MESFKINNLETKKKKENLEKMEQQQHQPVQAFQSLDRISNSRRSKGPQKKWMIAGVSLLALITLYILSSPGQTKSFYTLSSPTGTVPFWTFTDVHLAEDYVSGSDPTTFCTSGTGDAGKIGTFNCDVPRAKHTSGNKINGAAPILDSALSYTYRAALPSDAAKNRASGFALFLGDSSTLYEEHPLGTETEEQIESNMAALAEKLELRFGTRVFPSLGNHDRHPSKGCPLPSDPGYTSYLNMVAKLWSRWLEPRALETVRKGGYYYADVYSGIRLISLNTMFFWTENNELEEDIAGQFEWLENTLSSMASSSRKAIIFGHIPPFLNIKTKISMWTPYALNRYFDILKRYDSFVSVQIFGHMHADALMDVNDNKYAMVTPSLTPRLSSKAPLSGDTNGKHPAFRAYLVEPKTGEIADYVQYWANLTEGNMRGMLSWEKSYSFIEEYDLNSNEGVNSENIATVISKLSSSGETWCKFFRHMFSERYFSQGNSNDTRKFLICSMKHSTDSDAFGECMKTLEIQGDLCPEREEFIGVNKNENDN